MGGAAGAKGCVEQLRLGQCGDQPVIRRLPPRSLALLTRSIIEAKWAEAKAWAEAKVTGKKYRYGRHQKPREKAGLCSS